MVTPFPSLVHYGSPKNIDASVHGTLIFKRRLFQNTINTLKRRTRSYWHVKFATFRNSAYFYATILNMALIGMSSMWRKLAIGEMLRCKGNVWVDVVDHEDTSTHKGVNKGAMMGKDAIEGMGMIKGVGIGESYNLKLLV